MHVTSILAALLLSSVASAQVSTKSLVTCLTKQGPKSTSYVRTASEVLTLPWYAYRVATYTPSTTTTPATSTKTVSSTTTILSTTTLPVETDTLTATLSVTSTDSITVTITTVSTISTAVIVSSTDTSTIAASAGFIPIESSAPGSMKRRAADSSEHALEERQTQSRIRFAAKDGKVVCNPAVYPQYVKCVGLVAVVTTVVRTKTASTVNTITASTPVVTSTTIFTTSSTVTVTPARASTTTTITSTISTASTSTAIATSLTTVTGTTTVVAPQATFYAACAANNIINTINGQGIPGGSVIGNVGQNLITANSAYDCCVACITTASCGASAYVSGGIDCILFSKPDSTCSQSNVVITLSSGSPVYAISNGYCGVANPE